MAELDLQDIYARHRQGLFTLALSVTGCAARAEDAVHDAFVRLCRGSPWGVGDPVGYVFSAVRNAAIDQVRRSPPRAEGQAGNGMTGAASLIFNGDAPDGRAPRPDAGALDTERRRAVAEAVDSLPEEQRDAVVLRIYAQLTFAQIAEAVGAPLPTVATRYRRALERLKQRLERLQ